MKKLFTLLMSIFAIANVAIAQDSYIITGDYNGWSLTENCITFAEQDGGYVATAAEFKTGAYGFKIIKNPAVDGWKYQYGISTPIATGTDNTLTWIESNQGGNIHMGAVGNDITLHNVTFEFFPGSDGTLDYFKVTADETVTIIPVGPVFDNYMMVGTFQGWSFENNPLVFELKSEGVYEAKIAEIFGDWKIVKNKSWATAFGDGGKAMTPGSTYNMVLGGDNTGFALGVVLKDATFTLTVIDENNISLKVEGTATVQHSYGLVGSFQGWSTSNATMLTEQSEGVWTTDIVDFPGNQGFKVSIDKTWECFLGQDGPATLTFGVPYTCARGDNPNNLTIGETDVNYNVHVSLTVASDAQSAELVITDTTTGIELLRTNTNTKNNIYNVAGQKLGDITNGLNIINGKKVIVK